MLRVSALVACVVACAAQRAPTAPRERSGEPREQGQGSGGPSSGGSARAPAQSPPEVEVAMAALRADVEMICGAIQITGGTDVMSVGPYIAEHMKTDLLADLFANIRTTTTLDMIVERIRRAMAVTRVESCPTLDVLIAHDPRRDRGS
jgi:hypothetical protein